MGQTIRNAIQPEITDPIMSGCSCGLCWFAGTDNHDNVGYVVLDYQFPSECRTGVSIQIQGRYMG